jgi:uncharacterized cupredoxin-like copper-binding protein
MLVGCGSDDDDATTAVVETTVAASPTEPATTEPTSTATTATTEPETTDSATTEPATTDAAEADIDAVCEAYTEITFAFNAEPEGDPAEFLQNTVVPLIETLEANAPSEVADSLGVMTSAAQQVVDSGGEDFSAFEAPEFSEAQSEVDPYMFENCTYDATYEVSLIDYAFEGMPSEIEAGRVAILVTNEGSEAHEMALMSKAEGVTESWQELVELPEEEAMEKVNFVGGAFAPTTGSQGLLVVDIEPGEYAALCFIPTGTTMDGGEMTEGTGPPHLVQGMVQEFTVA